MTVSYDAIKKNQKLEEFFACETCEEEKEE
jgi:hypothetical protein